MRGFLLVLGAVILAIGIGVGNHSLVAIFAGQSADCGSGFTNGPPLNFGFGSTEVRDVLRLLCQEKRDLWQLYTWSAIGLGAAIMVGTAFLRPRPSAAPHPPSSDRAISDRLRLVLMGVCAIGAGIAVALVGDRLSGGEVRSTHASKTTVDAPAITTTSAISTTTTNGSVTTQTSTSTTTTSVSTESVPLKVEISSVGQHFVPVSGRSASIRCIIKLSDVLCELPQRIAGKGNGIMVRAADGSSGWGTGNMGLQTFQNLDYATVYGALGWTVQETEEGIRFTNNTTGHGMVVSHDDAQTF
jgi:hypothetical protein